MTLSTPLEAARLEIPPTGKRATSSHRPAIGAGRVGAVVSLAAVEMGPTLLLQVAIRLEAWS